LPCDTREVQENLARIAHAYQLLQTEQRAEHERLEELDVGFGEEVVRRAHRRLPDLEDAVAFVGADWRDVCVRAVHGWLRIDRH
jgi:hypothetical protein